MATEELRKEIHKAIDNLPENVLPELLAHINSIQKSLAEKDRLDQFFKRIVKEDHNLLKRLADS